MVNLFTCDSYFELFNVLANTLKSSAGQIEKRQIIFCEAKVSLMIERCLCSALGGSFSADVYSFGKYLLKKHPGIKALSKEGSAMAIKRILGEVQLKCLKNSKTTLATSLYDLIIQLKSAKITPQEIFTGADYASKNVLKNKLYDVAGVFDRYEKFLVETGVDDQSSLLTYLPQTIENDEEIAGADVYLVGYSGFTAQARQGIEMLAKKARSFTAILTEGDNLQAFVNETSDFIRDIARKYGMPVIYNRIKSDYTIEGKKIVNTLFTPVGDSVQKTDADRIYLTTLKNPYAEVERIAEIIKGKVLSGECRYKDFTVAIPEDCNYGELIAQAFDALDVPYFLDEKKKPTSHPLVTLILSYIDAKRKNLERKALSAFYKNPLFSDDKEFLDSFENYCIKYNVNFLGIKQPFTFEKNGEHFDKFESFRQKIVDTFKDFNVNKLLVDVDAQKKLESLTEKLKELGETEESAENAQVYSAVVKILDEMQTYLGGVDLSLVEYKNVFLSGINALELSIIPQYNDAVFVGGYKQTALVKADYLFAVGLTDAVPAIRQDVALLSDGDIQTLEEIKIKVEPKIKVVNHRTRECVALALGAFSKGLFVSYPLSGLDGKENAKSEVFTLINRTFNTKPFPAGDDYLTERQGRKSFAYSAGLFAEGRDEHFDVATAYYMAVGEQKLGRLLDSANKDVKIRLDNRQIEFGETSPTTIEEYFDCPYKTFLSKTLHLERRKQGELDALSVGVLVHDLLKNYADNISKVTDKESSDALFESVKQEIIQKEEYERFFLDVVQKTSLDRVLEECKKYCYKTFLSFKTSKFTISETEARFGGDEKKATYPAISLNGGKIRLKGVIDRVDESDKYFRVLDYKTGETDASEEKLFYGKKLQLYLYSSAVSAKLNDKTPAGLYYLPISDKYEDEKSKKTTLMVGKSLGDEDAILAQDEQLKENNKSEILPVKFVKKSGSYINALDGNTMDGFVKYAVRVSELAAERLCDGVIVPSPMEKACDYCDFKAMCDSANALVRTEKTVDESTIVGAVNGGEENA